MSHRMKTHFVFASHNLILKIELTCDKKTCYCNYKYTYSFQKKTLSNFICVLIYLLTKCLLEDDFKDSCYEFFVIFAEKYM